MVAYPVKILYTNRRGAGCVRMCKDYDEAWKILDKLRLTARVLDATGEEVGGCTWLSGADDGRRRWNPWLEKD